MLSAENPEAPALPLGLQDRGPLLTDLTSWSPDHPALGSSGCPLIAPMPRTHTHLTSAPSPATALPPAAPPRVHTSLSFRPAAVCDKLHALLRGPLQPRCHSPACGHPRLPSGTQAATEATPDPQGAGHVRAVPSLARKCPDAQLVSFSSFAVFFFVFLDVPVSSNVRLPASDP